MKRWTRRLLTLISVVLAVSLLAHPELRILAPLLDAIGLDGLMLLAGTPLLAAARTLPWRSWLAKLFLEWSGPVLPALWNLAGTRLRAA